MNYPKSFISVMMIIDYIFEQMYCRHKRRVVANLMTFSHSVIITLMNDLGLSILYFCSICVNRLWTVCLLTVTVGNSKL